MKKCLIIALLGGSAVVCAAQTHRFPHIDIYTGDPTGNACTDPLIQQSSTTGLLYTCQSGTMKVGGTSGSGTVSGQTNGKIPLATGATTVGAPSHLDDGLTTPATITATEPVVAPAATAAISDKGGQVYNIKAYGAQACPFDSTSAIQSAINAAAGSPVQFPAGKWCVSAPLMYYAIPPTNGTNPAGPTFLGAGHGRTQLMMLPSFTVPTSLTVNGLTAYPAPAIFDVQGIYNGANAAKFAFGGEISGFELTTYGCETNPAGGEPACAYIAAPAWTTGGHNGLEGISFEGVWNLRITNNVITYFTGDGIIAPMRLDMSSNGDLTGEDAIQISGNYIRFNKGWGINLGGTAAESTVGGKSMPNILTYNNLGGVRFGGVTNWLSNNSIAGNGCGQPVNNANAVSEFSGSSLVSQATCVSHPLGPGVWIGRDLGIQAGPYNLQISENGFDSNAAASIILESATNVRMWNNTHFTHDNSGFTFNTTFPPGYAANAPKVQVVVGTLSTINTSSDNDYYRADLFTNSGHPTAGTVAPNALLDPEVGLFDFTAVSGTDTYINQGWLMGGATAVGNVTAYAAGAGAIWGSPTLSAPSGGQQTVTAWPLNSQGWGYAVGHPPTLTVVGGDAAWTKATLVTLTQTSGALTGCTLTQAGGPYSRTPQTSVQDTGSGTGSGGAISLTTSGVSPNIIVTGCAIATPGSGYSNHVIGGVAPTCATPPVVAAVASNGISRISMSRLGNYGPWTPGSTPPVGVTVTVSDATGSGFVGTPMLWPTNIGSVGTPNLVWGVVGVTIDDTAHGFNMQSSVSPTATFNCPAGCVLAATGTPVVGTYLNPTLTVSNAGSCDANTPLWITAQNLPIASSNTNGNFVRDQGIVVTQTVAPTFTNQLTLDLAHDDLNFVRWSGNISAEYCGVLSNSLPTAACSHRIYRDNDGTNSRYLDFNTTVSGTTTFLQTKGAGSESAAIMTVGPGDGTNPLNFQVGGTTMYNIDSSGNFNRQAGNTGNVLVPTQSPGDSSTKAASTAFVSSAVAAAAASTVFRITAPVSHTGTTTLDQIINTAKIPANTGSATGSFTISLSAGACTGVGAPFAACSTLTNITGVSGGSGFSGTGTLFLTNFNNSCTGSTATVTITGGAFTSAVVTAGGTGCTVAPTSATCTSGTATCTGSPVSITVTSTAGINLGTCTVRLYLATTNAGNTTQVSGTTAVLAHNGAKITTDIQAQNSTTSEQVDTVTVAPGVNPSVTLITPQTFNLANDLYANVFMQNSSAGDICYVNQMKITYQQ